MIEALGLLATQGCRPLVISTGTTHDYRNPDYFPALCSRLEKVGLPDRLRFLGLGPYAEVAVLMRNAIAFINPSLFEGWSTTVEEAKSIGKRLMLSDLADHREQAPTRSLFFDPHSSDDLAAKMIEVLKFYDPVIERHELDCTV